jgi:hypothetical protein
MDERDKGRGIKKLVAHWVYVVQRQIYPEFAFLLKKESLVNLRPFSEAARTAATFAENHINP